MQPLYSASKCIPWLVVLIIECLAIVILNIITIVVFVKKKRQLQRRSTYLIIHLAIVDLLVGAVSGPLQIEIGMSQLCPLWNYRRKTVWSHPLSFAFVHLLISRLCERQPKGWCGSFFFFFILVHFPYKSYCYFLRTATRNIVSIQASLCEEMGL